MKTNGTFRIIAAPVLAVLAAITYIRSIPCSTSILGGGTYGGGRSAFLNVSGPRTRAMKRRHPL